ncbi:MAG: hypothetical protein NTZ67_02225 [Gammaproteobacteria bacterium]|nr:hypothetical protein [Gammaproteobacteria bacterium]
MRYNSDCSSFSHDPYGSSVLSDTQASDNNFPQPPLMPVPAMPSVHVDVSRKMAATITELQKKLITAQRFSGVLAQLHAKLTADLIGKKDVILEAELKKVNDEKNQNAAELKAISDSLTIKELELENERLRLEGLEKNLAAQATSLDKKTRKEGRKISAEQFAAQLTAEKLQAEETKKNELALAQAEAEKAAQALIKNQAAEANRAQKELEKAEKIAAAFELRIKNDLERKVAAEKKKADEAVEIEKRRAEKKAIQESKALISSQKQLEVKIPKSVESKTTLVKKTKRELEIEKSEKLFLQRYNDVINLSEKTDFSLDAALEPLKRILPNIENEGYRYVLTNMLKDCSFLSAMIKNRKTDCDSENSAMLLFIIIHVRNILENGAYDFSAFGKSIRPLPNSKNLIQFLNKIHAFLENLNAFYIDFSDHVNEKTHGLFSLHFSLMMHFSELTYQKNKDEIVDIKQNIESVVHDIIVLTSEIISAKINMTKTTVEKQFIDLKNRTENAEKKLYRLSSSATAAQSQATAGLFGGSNARLSKRESEIQKAVDAYSASYAKYKSVCQWSVETLQYFLPKEHSTFPGGPNSSIYSAFQFIFKICLRIERNEDLYLMALLLHTYAHDIKNKKKCYFGEEVKNPEKENPLPIALAYLSDFLDLLTVRPEKKCPVFYDQLKPIHSDFMTFKNLLIDMCLYFSIFMSGIDIQREQKLSNIVSDFEKKISIIINCMVNKAVNEPQFSVDESFAQLIMDLEKTFFALSEADNYVSIALKSALEDQVRLYQLQFSRVCRPILELLPKASQRLMQ